MTNKPIFDTIADLCMIFNSSFGITIANCTCANEEVRNMTKIFGNYDICESSKPSPDVQLDYEPQYSRSIASIILLFTSFGILGNVLVVIVALKNWKSSIPYQKLIGQLGASDLLFASLHLLTVFYLFWTNEWIYGETLCKLLTGSITLGSLFAVGLILIISIERYLAIVHPFFWKYGTKKLNYTLVAINMCLGIASVIPRFTYLHLTEENVCTEKWPEGTNTELIYELYIVIVYFCVPLIAMFYLNFRILYVLRHERMGSADCLRDSGKSTRKNSRTMRVLVSIIVAFMVLVMPNRVIMVYFVYKKYTGAQIADDTYTILTFVGLLPYSFHVAINPILYCIIDKSWRKQTIDLICCFRLFDTKNRRNSVDGSNVNSLEATCVKTCSFLSEHHRPNNMHNRPIAYVVPQKMDVEPLLPLPITAEVKHYSSSEASVEDVTNNDLSATNEPNGDAYASETNNNYFYTNGVLSVPENVLSLPEDVLSLPENLLTLPEYILSLPDDLLSLPEDLSSNGLTCPLIPDPDRETVL